MPQIPRYIPQQGVPARTGSGGSISLPFVSIPAGGAEYGAIARGAGQIADTLGQAADHYAKIDAIQRKAEAQNAVESGLLRLESGYADAELAARDQADPDQYLNTVRQYFQDAVPQIAGNMKHPEAATEFQRAAAKFALAKDVAARRERVGRRNALIITDDAEKNTLDANLMVFGTDEQVVTAARRVEARITQRVATGIYSPEQGVAERNRVRASVAKGNIALRMADPEQRVSAIDDLQNGRYQVLRPDEQLDLMRTHMERLHTERTRDEAERRRYVEDGRRDAVAQLTDQVFSGELPQAVALEKLRAVNNMFPLAREEYAGLHKLITDPGKGAPSDEATYNMVAGDVYSPNSRITSQQLDALHVSGKLNTKDWVEFKKAQAADTRRERAEARTLAATERAITATERSMRNQEITRAHQQLRHTLMVPDIIDKIDPIRDKLHAEASKELYERTVVGREDPKVVIEDMRPRYSRALGDRLLMDAEQIRPLLTHPSPEALERDKARLPDSEYRRQRGYFERLGEIRRQLELAAQTAEDKARAEKAGSWFGSGGGKRRGER